MCKLNPGGWRAEFSTDKTFALIVRDEGYPPGAAIAFPDWAE